MTETNLAQFAMEQGIEKNIKQMSQAEKVQLRYNLCSGQHYKRPRGLCPDVGQRGQPNPHGQGTIKAGGGSPGAESGSGGGQCAESAQQHTFGFQKLNPAQQKMILGIAGIAAAAGPVIKLRNRGLQHGAKAG